MLWMLTGPEAESGCLVEEEQTTGREGSLEVGRSPDAFYVLLNGIRVLVIVIVLPNDLCFPIHHGALHIYY